MALGPKRAPGRLVTQPSQVIPATAKVLASDLAASVIGKPKKPPVEVNGKLWFMRRLRNNFYKCIIHLNVGNHSHCKLSNSLATPA